MAAELKIVENGRALHFIYDEPLMMEDANRLNHEAELYYDSADRPVPALIDLRKVKTLPKGILGIRSASPVSHPNAGDMVVIGAKGITKAMAELVVRLARFDQISFVESEEEAWAKVRKLIGETV